MVALHLCGDGLAPTHASVCEMTSCLMQMITSCFTDSCLSGLACQQRPGLQSRDLQVRKQERPTWEDRYHQPS